MRELFPRKRSAILRSGPAPESSLSTTFCCRGLEYFSNEAGKRGFGIFSDDAPDTEASFILQFRALDPQAPKLDFANPVSVVSEIRMIYCPWCGVKLKEFYANRMEELERPDLKIN